MAVIFVNYAHSDLIHAHNNLADRLKWDQPPMMMATEKQIDDLKYCFSNAINKQQHNYDKETGIMKEIKFSRFSYGEKTSKKLNNQGDARWYIHGLVGKPDGTSDFYFGYIRDNCIM